MIAKSDSSLRELFVGLIEPLFGDPEHLVAREIARAFSFGHEIGVVSVVQLPLQHLFFSLVTSLLFGRPGRMLHDSV